LGTRDWVLGTGYWILGIREQGGLAGAGRSWYIVRVRWVGVWIVMRRMNGEMPMKGNGGFAS